MNPDRRRRVIRTFVQAAIPAALLLLANLGDSLPTLLSGNGLIIGSAVLTTLVSLLHNLGDAQLDKRAAPPEA